jgi:DNA-binding CsgD family transcriptional regulator
MTSSPSARGRNVPARDLLALLDASDLQVLIDAGFGLLQRVVRCDFSSAFYRTSQRGLLRERDSRGIVYTPQFMQRAVTLNPAIPLALANPGVRILATRIGMPGPDSAIRASAFYREVMQPQGWRHAIALCFWGEPAGALPVFVLSVYRAEGRSDFATADVTRLEDLYPFIACAVNRLHQREKAKSMSDGMAVSGRDGNRGLAVLDANLRLVEANPMARRLAGAWAAAHPARQGGNGRAVWTLPAQLARACELMRHEWECSLTADPRAKGLSRRRKLAHPRVKALSATISMVCRNTTDLSEPSYVLELERRAPRAAVNRRRHAPLMHLLTAGEQAVAIVLMEGVSNQEIADRLAKSVDAVKFLLHRIYQKTGVSGRAALVARLRA